MQHDGQSGVEPYVDWRYTDMDRCSAGSKWPIEFELWNIRIGNPQGGCQFNVKGI
jgi:hypothetical protein